MADQETLSVDCRQMIWGMSLKKTICGSALFIALFIAYAEADIYRFRDDKGIWHFTDIPSDKRYRLYIKRRGIRGKQYLKKYDAIIRQAAERYGVDANLVKAIIKTESSFDPSALSERGAQGLMQLMPGTADEMDVADPFDPEENIFGGTRYLSLLIKRFKQDKRLAVAAYNGGPTAVANCNGIPPIPQTKRFVKKVMKYYDEFRRLRGHGSNHEQISPTQE